MKWICIGLLPLVLWSCDYERPERAPFVEISANREAAPDQFPKSHVALSPHLARILTKAESLREIVPVSSFVKLEVTQHSVVGRIDNVVYIEGNWFILDRIQKRVYQFGGGGEFIRQVGQTGQGPGEYESPFTIRRIFDNLLAISDYEGFLVFDTEGQFVEERILRFEDRLVFPGYCFIWDDPDRMFLADFRSSPFSSLGPSHLIIDFSEGQGKISHGFGERFEFMEKALTQSIPIWAYQSFTKIEGNIWTGSPYNAEVEIWDQQGRLAGRLQSEYANQLTHEDFEKIRLNPVEISLLKSNKLHNLQMFQVGDLVLVVLEGQRGNAYFTYDIYDIHGNPRKAGISHASPYGMVLHSFGSVIVGQMPVFDTPERYLEWCTEDELALLVNAGWDPHDFDNDNPYLVVGELLDK